MALMSGCQLSKTFCASGCGAPGLNTKMLLIALLQAIPNPVFESSSTRSGPRPASQEIDPRIGLPVIFLGDEGQGRAGRVSTARRGERWLGGNQPGHKHQDQRDHARG